MKLLIAVVHDQCITKLNEQLVSKGYRSTKLSSTGGFLRAGNTTLLIGVDGERVEDVLAIIRSVCRTADRPGTSSAPIEQLPGVTAQPVKMLIGGAVVFVLNAAQWGRSLTPPEEHA